ncbi:hypothetical protein EHP00_778 [Ecytonucleospora hepatopenaei]|uniref:Uncharacterized protein n=1 Tax=Ecytonucleospora hepatopenaei TaxID=646526 RepID=A0A1W0E7X3_9MICR|nr:hypothetical protein EHP00_778 [Ecytonucleospora hepatopenaei]
MSYWVTFINLFYRYKYKCKINISRPSQNHLKISCDGTFCIILSLKHNKNIKPLGNKKYIENYKKYIIREEIEYLEDNKNIQSQNINDEINNNVESINNLGFRSNNSNTNVIINTEKNIPISFYIVNTKTLDSHLLKIFLHDKDTILFDSTLEWNNDIININSKTIEKVECIKQEDGTKLEQIDFKNMKGCIKEKERNPEKNDKNIKKTKKTKKYLYFFLFALLLVTFITIGIFGKKKYKNK